MDKDIVFCPVCGSEMEALSSQLWSCKCGHRTTASSFKQEDTGEEGEKEEIQGYRKRHWEGTKGRIKQKKLPHKSGVVDRKKRTSV